MSVSVSLNLNKLWGRGTPTMCVLLVAVMALMQGCSTMGYQDAQSLAGASSYKELMQAAEDALKSGEPAEAFLQFDKAAKLDPSKKQPWLRMAQAHFDARNYGPAIIAGQEVLQRDNSDVAARTILAASGLRVAARALEQLRAANVAVVSTLEEARTLSRTMRDVLGEPLLPTNPQEIDFATGQPVPGTAPQRKWAPTAAGQPAPARVASPAPTTPRAVGRAPVSGARRNPFDVLKD